MCTLRYEHASMVLFLKSEVEHRGVVLGMMQLDDKPSFQPRAYITEIENETDETGQLKDAQFDDQVMVYPKWHENGKLLHVLDTICKVTVPS